MRIALASERPPKVEAVRAALAHIAALELPGWRDFELTTRATPSGVAATPMHDDELRRGALQGAAVWLRSWACAWDGKTATCGCGPSLLLPHAIAAPVLRGEISVW